VRPAWSDENLLSLARQIKSGLFFAHVRASTGTATTRANCHPFAHGSWMFMHNGKIGGWDNLRRQIEMAIPDHLFRHRQGTTDSEALFLLLLANGLEEDPKRACGKTAARYLPCGMPRMHRLRRSTYGTAAAAPARWWSQSPSTMDARIGRPCRRRASSRLGPAPWPSNHSR
jgi:predicted glutamine amidotransferase